MYVLNGTENPFNRTKYDNPKFIKKYCEWNVIVKELTQILNLNSPRLDETIWVQQTVQIRESFI